MIKAEELRVGNLVFNSFTKSNQLISYHEIRILSLGLRNHYTPIPLTEEWLLKLGFDKGPNYHPEGVTYKRKIGGCIISTTSLYPYLWIDDNLCNHNFKYVHQLQNLYYALTGQELTISTGE